MSFFDRVGSVFSKLGAIGGDTASHIGAAYTAANNNEFGHAILATAAFAAQPVVSGADAANNIRSYGVSRPLSTIAQVDTAGTFGNYLNLDSWHQAWNRSADISPGQAFAIDSAEITGVQADGSNSNIDLKNNDPFAPEAAAQRHQLFVADTKGKLATGATDALLGQFLDPVTGVAKLGFAAKAASQVVAKGDRAEVLAHAVTGKAAPRTSDWLTKHQGDRAGKLIDKIDNTPLAKLPALPEFSNSADAGALATAFERAKNLNPGNTPEETLQRRQAIAHVLGASWGDEASQDALALQQGMLAITLEKLSNITPQAQAESYEVSFGKNGQGVFDIFSDRNIREIDAQRADIQNQLANVQRVRELAGQSEARVTSTLPQKVAARGLAKSVDESLADTLPGPGPVRVTDSLAPPESWLKTAAGTPIRVVGNALTRRVPGSVNIKDSAAGYQDMVGILGQMKHTPSFTKKDLLTKFIQAGNANDRMNIVNQLRQTLVRDTGAKYGYDPKTIEAIINSGEEKMTGINSLLSTRAYSAADEAGNTEGDFFTFSDPTEDIHHVFHKPFMQTQLEDTVNVLDPKEVDRVFKAHAGLRFMDKFGVGDQADEVAQFAQAAGGEFTNLWKTSALIRLAYPLRIQTDSQLRLMAHMGAASYMHSLFVVRGKTRLKALTSIRDKGQPLVEMAEGEELKHRHDLSIGATLGQKVAGDGAFDISPEDFGKIYRTVIDGGGNNADLMTGLSDHLTRKVRTGNFGTIQPNDPKWLPAYLRAVNHQISNDPTAIELLKDGNVNRVAREVRRQIKEGGPLAREYREIGHSFRSIEEWLGTINTNNNHLLPSQEMRQWVLPRVKRGVDKATQEDAISDLPEEINPKTGKAIKPKPQLKPLNAPESGRINADVVKRHFANPNTVEKPMPVHGEGYNIETQSALLAGWKKVQQSFFRWAAEMPENTAARAPLFMHAYGGHIEATLGRLEGQEITLEHADAIRRESVNMARRDMGRILFNATDTSNLSHSMRFISPFFAAWEDTMNKWGQLMYDNPALLTRASKFNPNKSGMVFDQNGNEVDEHGRVFDKDGNQITDPKYNGGGEFILLPKMLTSWIPGPLTDGAIKIRKDSINSVFQGDPWWLPGFGPAVQVPANYVVREAFPKEVNDPLMRYVLPYGTTTDSIKDQFLPKWLKTARNAFGNTQDFNNQQAIFLAEATSDYQHGGKKPDLKAIANKTRNYFILRAVVDNASPVSIQPDSKYQFYIDKAHEYRSDPKRDDWQKDFYNDFPGFYDMSISLSANNTGIQASASAYDASIKYRNEIRENPELGWLFVGPANAGDFSNGVYDWQQTNSAGKGLNFRGKKDPQVALEQANAEQGWQQWNAFRTSVNLELQKRGLYSTQQKGAEDLAAANQGFEAWLQNSNPDWANAKAESGGPGKAGRMIDAAQAFIDKHPDVKNRPDMVALGNYIAIRQQVKNELAARNNSSLQYNPDLKAALQAYGKQLADNNIGFESMWNRTLEFDDLSDVDAQEAA
jgi:hypothetical protein